MIIFQLQYQYNLQYSLQLSMQVENQKAIDNALFKKLEDITIKMPSDPKLYTPDVDKYLNLYKIELQKVQGDTMKKNQRFGELLIFLARAVRFFPEKLGWIPGGVMRLMQELGMTLHHYLRKKCVGAVMILRAKNILLPVSTLQFLLKLMRIQDKGLRSMIYKYVVNDLRRMNKHHKNNKINQQIMAFIAGYIPKHTDKTSQKSLKLMIELYKRNIWTDNKAVNIIAESCFAPSSRLRVMACYFLMETTEQLDQLPDSDDEPNNPQDVKQKKGITRQTKHKQRLIEKEKKRAARRLRKKEIASRNTNFMPIDLIYNPQIFTEKLFNIMSGKQQKYNHKLIYMGLIGRVIWRHQLIVLPFYRSMIRFLEPKQKDVHKVLIALAESVHELVPEDQIQTIVKHIIEHFVNDRCSEFTMTVGLNTLRQIFKKLPSIITEEMMLYLCTYYEYRNKNVSRAAKSVINFVRQYEPMLIEKKYRGNFEKNVEQTDQHNKRSIPGVELLPYEGNIPIQMDRILTDQDFRQIRKLKKRQQQREDHGRRYDNEIEQSAEQNEDIIEVEENQQDEIQGQEEDDEEIQQEGDDEEQDQIEVIDDLAEEDVEQQEEEQQLQSDSDNQDGQSFIQWSDAEEVQVQDEEEVSKKNKKTKMIKKQEKAKKNHNKKKAGSSDEDESDSQEDYLSQSQSNNNGFIAPNQIAYYKMSKTEQKADKKAIKEGKDKFKHKPKDKKGGSNDREKQKLKPLMMIRAKKNKIRSNEKQLKVKIKSLKNQLGKVRSGKQAKRLKNKKIVKLPKRT